jgi:hypothetical protein
MTIFSAFRAFLVLFFAGAVSAIAAPSAHQLIAPLAFEPNLGQAPAQVSWLAHGPGYQFLLTGHGATVVFQKFAPNAQRGSLLHDARLPSPQNSLTTLQMKLRGSRAWNALEGIEPTGGVTNYLLKDPKNWRTDIPLYAKVKASNVYNGIDLVFYSRGANLEYDFVVAPGADPKQIKMTFDGAQALRIDSKTGDLIVTAAAGSELRHEKPRVYQQIGNRQIEVPSAYTLVGQSEVAFTLAAYDQHRTLLIDPTVRFTTFLAGSNSDVAGAVAVDDAGNSYVTGYTLSTNFPSTTSVQAHGSSDAFVTKLSPTGAILFSTYLGGAGVDIGSGIAVDSEGIYITGYTDSKDFPSRDHRTGSGPKGGDAFVTKLGPANGFLYYTYFLGGSSLEHGYAISVDSSHAAYVAGITYSNDFPTTGGIQPTFGGVRDAFVAKVNPLGYYLDWSTYMGGSDFDAANSLAVDSAGFVYVTGVTASADFPANGPSQGFPSGASSVAFVTKIRPGGLGTVYSILWGGGDDSGLAITADANGNAYVGGATGSLNLFTSSGAFQKTKPSPTSLFSGFITKFTDPGIWVFSTYLSGTNGDTFINAIALNGSGDVYVAGDTSSTTLPGAPGITPNPTAGFLTKLNSTLGTLNYTVFLGAKINGLVVTQPVTRLPIFTYPTIYTTGYRYTGGLNAANIDAFVVKLDERPVLQPLMQQ